MEEDRGECYGGCHFLHFLKLKYIEPLSPFLPFPFYYLAKRKDEDRKDEEEETKDEKEKVSAMGG